MSILGAKPVFFATALLFFAGCQTEPSGIQNAKIAMAQRIAAEPAGDYYIGRRYFKPDFKFWGYVRRPNQPWGTAQLVMLNEKQKLAPDRAALKFGSDNNYEYKLYGNFSGDKVYEPASNRVYPEFILKDYEVISTNPPPIFKTQISGRADAAQTRYMIEKPEPQFQVRAGRASTLDMTKDTSVAAKKDNLAEEFLRYLAIERNASPRTLKAYRQALGAFRGQNQKPWKQCTADDFRDYLFAIMKRGQARSYVRLQFSALRAFYKFLADRKKLRIDPVRQLQLPKVDKKLPLVLTRQQIEELLAAPLKIPKQRAAPEWMPLRDVAVMELFYSSGLRLSELAILDVEDVDLYTESVRVFGKGRKE